MRKRIEQIHGLQRVNDAIVLILEGKSSKEVTNYLVRKYHISGWHALKSLTIAREKIKERKALEVDNLISLHIERYEYIYAKLYDMKMYINAQNALKAKEKLMGLHKEGFHMRVTNAEVTAVGLQQVVDEFNVMKLSDDNRKRLEELLTKTRS